MCNSNASDPIDKMSFNFYELALSQQNASKKKKKKKKKCVPLREMKTFIRKKKEHT